jgi:hypothetical protein
MPLPAILLMTGPLTCSAIVLLPVMCSTGAGPGDRDRHFLNPIEIPTENFLFSQKSAEILHFFIHYLKTEGFPKVLKKQYRTFRILL